MKLATLKNGTRDGRLVVVSRDLTHYADASHIAPTLQAALDDWKKLSGDLMSFATSLENGSVQSERFREHDTMSPLPRAAFFIAGDDGGHDGMHHVQRRHAVSERCGHIARLSATALRHQPRNTDCPLNQIVIGREIRIRATF